MSPRDSRVKGRRPPASAESVQISPRAARGASSPWGWVYLVALGLGATGLGRCLYLWVVRSAGSVRASLVTYITPVVGVFLGWAVLGEGIGLDMIAGGALIASGVAGVMYGRRFPLAGLNLARLGFGRARGGEAEAGASARTFT